jgi:hypothetical protein
VKRRWFVLMVGSLVIVSAVAVTSYYVGSRQPTHKTLTDQLLERPLNGVDFPKTARPYPSSWPNVLTFSQQFVVVQVMSNPIPASADYPAGIGYTAKLRYSGDRAAAMEAISNNFVSNGWRVERRDLPSGGYQLFVQLSDKKSGSGQIIIDSDSDQTAVLLDVRL